MKAFKFTGKGSQYFKIWIVNVFLTVVTLGLYYPWAKVRNYRYFYANTQLENRNFEYHATGKQLFISYLIAMVLLLIYIFIQSVSPIGGAIVFLILFLSLPWIVWRSLMFNMRMTSFSSVRFSFAGSLGLAYVNYLLLPIVLILVIYAIPIGIFYIAVTVSSAFFVLLLAVLPVVLYLIALLKKRSAEYVINGSRYGQGEFATQFKTAKFVDITLKTWGLAIALVLGLLVLVALLSMVTGLGGHLLQYSGQLQDPEAVMELFGGSLAWLIIMVYLGFLLISFIVLSYSYVRQREYIFANAQLDGEIRFSSKLTVCSMASVMISNFLLVILTLGLALPWAKVRMAKLVVENSEIDAKVGFDQYVTQQQEHQSSLGEQLGDAFDVDVGIGI